MANPNVQMGSLNRLLGSVLFPGYPALNVTPSFLGPEGIDANPEGQATAVLPAMTGVVTSPEPYQMFRITLHLLKSQAFADVWKQQMEYTSLLGDCTVRPDSAQLSPYLFNNVSIVGVDRLAFSGRDAGFNVNLVGSYQLNSRLWE